MKEHKSDEREGGGVGEGGRREKKLVRTRETVWAVYMAVRGDLCSNGGGGMM